MEKNKVLNAVIIAASIVAFGFILKAGLDNFTNKDRRVTVKGLSEREVPADYVSWPIATATTGNDLQQVYDKVSVINGKIRRFLLKNGISEDEILESTPQLEDREANRYNNEPLPFKYKISSVITVSSRNVDKVRELIARQGELIGQGIAIINDGWSNQVRYDFISFTDLKPEMMQEAVTNAQNTAKVFAQNSNSRLNKIVTADQGQFSIGNKDDNTPYIKKLRVVTTITYSLKN